MNIIDSPDYWAILGIFPGSDSADLKRAFRREARKWHPDLNLNDPRAEERFKLVNEAYAVLSDPRKRSLWESNQSLIETNVDPFSEGFPDFNEYLDVVLGEKNSKEFSIEENSEDDSIYDSYIHSPPVTSSPPPHPIQAFEDIETLVDLTPDQALYGTEIDIELENGTLVQVDTPPRVGDGWRLRLSGVAPGFRDHFLHLRVQTNEGLRIDGLRVLYKLELLPADAVLGCAVEVPTIDGPVTLQVPPGSSSGRLLRLRGRGLEEDTQRGDQLVEIVIVLPEELRDSELALYERLQELSLELE